MCEDYNFRVLISFDYSQAASYLKSIKHYAANKLKLDGMKYIWFI